jgi:predicted alpha-1,2-mannosidase
MKMLDGNGASRRSFLKLGGAVALLSSLENGAKAAPKPDSRDRGPLTAGRQSTSPALLVDYVNPLQGTDSTPLFSRGNTLPIVAVPFAMAHWALQCSDRDAWFFQPHDQRLQGIRCTHQLSMWLGDYGHATFMPFSGDPDPEPSARASSYRPDELKIAPHCVRVPLLRYGCTLELAPAERCAVMRFTYKESGASGAFIDLPGLDSEAHIDSASSTVTALVRANSGGVPAGFAAYHAIKIDVKITQFDVKELKDRRVAVLRFRAEAGKPVNLRLGTSFISHEQAVRNLDSEVGGKPFEQVKTEAAAVWELALGRVRIQGASETQRRTFYSCLYRALLFPRIWHERDAQGSTVHYSAFSGKVEPGVMYADHGYWDLYRAWYPMMTLLYPERLGEILEGWVNAYKEGGWFPQFPCPGYRNCMTGSPIDSVFGDAVVKGIRGFDVQAAYTGLRKHATQSVPPGKGYGRSAVAQYVKLGYVPCDLVDDGLVETLDSAFGDFNIAQIARAVGAADDAAMFLKRSQSWRNLFDAKTGFLRGRLANGAWLEPFDAHTWGNPYVEGSAWQYRFAVPHDPDGLMEAMGGKAAFLAALDEILADPSVFNVGSYGREIHEMSEMAAVDFGQYAHSNQPSHHVLYMFTAAGHRDRTQHWVHRVLNELYSPDNFCGDEDTGSMGAWYVLSALGIYSLCPGKPEWTLGAPLFEQSDIRFPGREIRIEAHGAKPGALLSRVTLNGIEEHGPCVAHSALVNGGRLVFSRT